MIVMETSEEKQTMNYNQQPEEQLVSNVTGTNIDKNHGDLVPQQHLGLMLQQLQSIQQMLTLMGVVVPKVDSSSLEESGERALRKGLEHERREREFLEKELALAQRERELLEKENELMRRELDLQRHNLPSTSHQEQQISGVNVNVPPLSPHTMVPFSSVTHYHYQPDVLGNILPSDSDLPTRHHTPSEVSVDSTTTTVDSLRTLVEPNSTTTTKESTSSINELTLPQPLPADESRKEEERETVTEEGEDEVDLDDMSLNAIRGSSDGDLEDEVTEGNMEEVNEALDHALYEISTLNSVEQQKAFFLEKDFSVSPQKLFSEMQPELSDLSKLMMEHMIETDKFEQSIEAESVKERERVEAVLNTTAPASNPNTPNSLSKRPSTPSIILRKTSSVGKTRSSVNSSLSSTPPLTSSSSLSNILLGSSSGDASDFALFSSARTKHARQEEMRRLALMIPSLSKELQPYRQLLCKLNVHLSTAPEKSDARFLLLFNDLLCVTTATELEVSCPLKSTWVLDLEATLTAAISASEDKDSNKPEDSDPTHKPYFSAPLLSRAYSERPLLTGSSPTLMGVVISEDYAPLGMNQSERKKVANKGTLLVKTPEKQYTFHAVNASEKKTFLRMVESATQYLLLRLKSLAEDGRRFFSYEYQDQSFYSGFWRDALFDGKGVLVSRKGDKYDGEWVGGLREGSGTSSNSNGDKFEGEWKANCRHGPGSEFFAFGSEESNLEERFTGTWERDKRHGFGELCFNNKSRMYADWREGEPSFPCLIKYSNGERYVGDLEGFRTRHGWGIQFYNNGEKYYGLWSNDQRQGSGVCFSRFGAEYIGDWNGDKIEGKGKIKLPDETLIVGKMTGNWNEVLSIEGTQFRLGNSNPFSNGGSRRRGSPKTEKWESFISTKLKKSKSDLANACEKFLQATLLKINSFTGTTVDLNMSCELEVQSGLAEVFKCVEHPLGSIVSAFIQVFVTSFRGYEDTEDAKLNAVDDVLAFFSQLSSVASTFLASAVNGATEIEVDDIRQALSTVVVPRIYSTLTALYQSEYEKEDKLVYEHSTYLCSFELKDQLFLLGIQQEHWEPLTKQISSQLQRDEKGHSPGVPFSEAIHTLKQLPTLKNAQEKLECLKLTAKNIEDYLHSFIKSFGADEFLPMFCFVVAQAQLRNLKSECAFLEDFLDESIAHSLYGYLMAQLQIGMGVLSGLDIRIPTGLDRTITTKAKPPTKPKHK